MLLEMLRKNEAFQKLPQEKQHMFAVLAEAFSENDLALYLSPKELADKLQVGNKNTWQEFLNLEVVNRYIKGQMGQIAQIASRKTFMALKTEGERGNVQAIKQLNEISGVLNSGERNKVIVLHQIKRPEVVRQ